MKQPTIFYAVDKEDVDIKIAKLEEQLEDMNNGILSNNTTSLLLVTQELEIYKSIRSEYPIYTDNEWHK